MIRKFIPGLLGLALAATATVAAAQGKIAIGYQLPLTGDNSQYGTMFKNSAQMALDEFNKSASSRAPPWRSSSRTAKATPRKA